MEVGYDLRNGWLNADDIAVYTSNSPYCPTTTDSSLVLYIIYDKNLSTLEKNGIRERHKLVV